MTQEIDNYEEFTAYWEWVGPDGNVYTDSFIYPDADGQLDEHLRKYIAPDFERDFSVDRTEWAFDSACGYMRKITPGGEDDLTPPPVYSLSPSPKPRLNVLFFPTMASQFAHIMAIFDNDEIQVGDKVTLKTNVSIIQTAKFFLGVENKTDVDLFVVSKRLIDGDDIYRWGLPDGASVCILADWRYFLRGYVYKYEPFYQVAGCDCTGTIDEEGTVVQLKTNPLSYLNAMPPFTEERYDSSYVFLRLFWGLFKSGLFSYDDFNTALTKSVLFTRGTPTGLSESEVRDYNNGLYPYSKEEQEIILKTGQLPLLSPEYSNSQLDPSVFREGAPLLLLLDAALAVCGQRLYSGTGETFNLFPGGGDEQAVVQLESVSPRFPPLVCFFPDLSEDYTVRAGQLRDAFLKLKEKFDEALNIKDSSTGYQWLNGLHDVMKEFGGDLWLHWRGLPKGDPEATLEKIGDLTYTQTIEWISDMLTSVIGDMANKDSEYQKELEALKETLEEWKKETEPQDTPSFVFVKLSGYVETIIDGADFVYLAELEANLAKNNDGETYDASKRSVVWAFPDNYFVPTYWKHIPYAEYFQEPKSTATPPAGGSVTPTPEPDPGTSTGPIDEPDPGTRPPRIGEKPSDDPEPTPDPGGGDDPEPTPDPGGGDDPEPTPDPGGGSGTVLTAPLDLYEFLYPEQNVSNPEFRASITVLTSIWIKTSGKRTNRFALLNIAPEVESACRETARRIASRIEMLMLLPESKTFFFGAQGNNDLVYSDREQYRELFDKVSTFARLDVNPICLPIGSPRPKYGDLGSRNASGGAVIEGIYPFIEETVSSKGSNKVYVLDSHTPIKLDAETYWTTISLPLSWVNARHITKFESLDCWSNYEDDQYGRYDEVDKDNAFIEHEAVKLNAFDFSILVNGYDSSLSGGKTPITGINENNGFEIVDATQTICWRGYLINGVPSLATDYSASDEGESIDYVMYGAKHKGSYSLPDAHEYYQMPWDVWGADEKGGNKFEYEANPIVGGDDEPDINAHTSFKRYDNNGVLRVRVTWDEDRNCDKYEIFDHRGNLVYVAWPDDPTGARYELYQNGELLGQKEGLPPGMTPPLKDDTERDIARIGTTGGYSKYLFFDTFFTVDTIETPYKSVNGYTIDWRGMRIDGTKPYKRYSSGDTRYIDPISEGFVSTPSETEYNKSLTVEEQMESTESGLLQFIHFKDWLTVEVGDGEDYRGKEFNIDWRGMRLGGLTAAISEVNSDLDEPIKREETSEGDTDKPEGSGLVQFLHADPWLTVDLHENPTYEKKEYTLGWRGLFVQGEKPKNDSGSSSSSDSSSSDSSSGTSSTSSSQTYSDGDLDPILDPEPGDPLPDDDPTTPITDPEPGDGGSGSGSSGGSEDPYPGSSGGTDDPGTSGGTDTGGDGETVKVSGYAKLLHFKSPLSLERKNSTDYPGQEYEVSVKLDNLEYEIDTEKKEFLTGLGTPTTQNFLTGLGEPEKVKALCPSTAGFDGITVPSINITGNKQPVVNITLTDEAETGTDKTSLGQVVTAIEKDTGSDVTVLTDLRVIELPTSGSSEGFESLTSFIKDLTPQDERFCKSITLGDNAEVGNAGEVVVDVTTSPEQKKAFIKNVSLSQTAATGSNKITIGKVLTSASSEGSDSFIKGLSIATTAATGTGKTSIGQILTNAAAGGMTPFVKNLTIDTSAASGSNKTNIGQVVVSAGDGGKDSFVDDVTLSPQTPSGTYTNTGEVVVNIETQDADFLVVPENPQKNGIKSIATTPITLIKSVSSTPKSVVSSVTVSSTQEVLTPTNWEPRNFVTGLSAAAASAQVVTDISSSGTPVQAITALDTSCKESFLTAASACVETVTPIIDSTNTTTEAFLASVESAKSGAVTSVTPATGSFLTGVTPTTEAVYLPVVSNEDKDDAVYDVETTSGVFMTNSTLTFDSFVKSATGVSGTAVGSVYVDENDSTAKEEFVYDLVTEGTAYKQSKVAHNLNLANASVVTGASLVAATASEGGFQVVTAVRCVNDQIEYDTAYVKIQLTTIPLSQLITFSEATVLKGVGTRKKQGICKIATTPVSVLTGLTTVPANAATGINNVGTNAIMSVTPLTKQFLTNVSSAQKSVVTAITPSYGSAVKSISAPTSEFVTNITPVPGEEQAITNLVMSPMSVVTSIDPSKAKQALVDVKAASTANVAEVTPTKKTLGELLEFDKDYGVAYTTNPEKATVVKSISAPKTSVAGPISTTPGDAIERIEETEGYFIECEPASSGSSGGATNTAKAITNVTATKYYLGKSHKDAVTSISATTRYLNAETANAATSVTPTKRYLNATTANVPTSVNTVEQYIVAETEDAITGFTPETKYLNTTSELAITKLGADRKYLATKTATVETGFTPTTKYLNIEQSDLSSLIDVQEAGKAVSMGEVEQKDVIAKLNDTPPNLAGLTGYTQTPKEEAVTEVKTVANKDEEQAQGDEGGDANANN